VWGGVPALLEAGFETLVEAGISPEVAYMECVGELSLIAALIEERGIAGMREAISNTAELGAVLGGPKIVDAGLKARMRTILEEVRAGGFTRALSKEEAEGYPLLKKARSEARASALEAARGRLGGEQAWAIDSSSTWRASSASPHLPTRTHFSFSRSL
jgi:ketol-acid reductoisomerase